MLQKKKKLMNNLSVVFWKLFPNEIEVKKLKINVFFLFWLLRTFEVMSNSFVFLQFLAVSTTVSLVLSIVFAVMLFSTMQLYRPWFASSQLNTILGGYIGSWLFVLALTVRCYLFLSINSIFCVYLLNIYDISLQKNTSIGNFKLGNNCVGWWFSSEIIPRDLLLFGWYYVCLWNNSSCMCIDLVSE